MEEQHKGPQLDILEAEYLGIRIISDTMQFLCDLTHWSPSAIKPSPLARVYCTSYMWVSHFIHGYATPLRNCSKYSETKVQMWIWPKKVFRCALPLSMRAALLNIRVAPVCSVANDGLPLAPLRTTSLLCGRGGWEEHISINAFIVVGQTGSG